MTPYADVIHRRRWEDDAVASGSPEPQDQLADFRSGQRVSEVAAFAARLMMDGIARWSGPAEIRCTDMRVDPEDPGKLICSLAVRLPTPLLFVSFTIDPPKEEPAALPLARDNGGCPVPGCGQPRTQQFNVQVSSGINGDGLPAHDQFGNEEVSEYVRGACCPKSEHRMYVTMALKREHAPAILRIPQATEADAAALRQQFNASINGVDNVWRMPITAAAGITLRSDPGMPPGRCLVRRRSGPDLSVAPPVDQHDIDGICAVEPTGNIVEILMAPVDLSTYNKGHYARHRVILDPVTLTETHVPVAEAPAARACECGSAKAGLPTHSSWCPRGKP